MVSTAEEELIAHVVRIRQASAAPLNAAQVHAALKNEGLTFELSAVKKAASKATKRMGSVPAAPIVAPADTAPASSKQASKKQAAAAEALKAAEARMMTAQKALRDRWMFDGMGLAPGGGKPTDTKAFIEHAAAHAISGVLTEGENVSKERVEADVAMLVWILAPCSPFGDMFASEEDRLAAKAQYDRIEALRGSALGRVEAPFRAAEAFGGSRSGCVFKLGPQGLGYYHEAWLAAFSACYKAPTVEAKPYTPSEIDLSDAAGCDPALAKVLDEIMLNDSRQSASLDRAMAKASALAVANSGSAMDDID